MLGVLQVLRQPRSPSFLVTPKGEQIMEQTFISSLSRPFYILLVLNAGAIVWGIMRWLAEPWHRGAIDFVVFWAVLDTLLLLAALGAMLERPQRRTEPRAAFRESLVAEYDGAKMRVTGVDASRSGIKIHMTRDDFQAVLQCLNIPSWPRHDRVPKDILCRFSQATWHMHFPEGGSLACVLRNVAFNQPKERYDLGFNYIFESSTDERLAVAAAFGDSARLQRNVDYRHGGKSVPAAFWYLIRLGFHHGSLHIVYLIRNMLGRGWLVCTRILTKET